LSFCYDRWKSTYTKLKEEKGKENPSKVKQRKRSNVEEKGGEGHEAKGARGKEQRERNM
jgi:hypothetical protein